MDDDALAQALWLFDNLTSFSLHIVAVLAAVALTLFLTRSPRLGLVVLLGAAPFAGFIAWSALAGAPVGACAGADARLRVATVNLLITNRDRDAVARFLASERPDVVAFEEAGDWWSGVLGDFARDYPHRAMSPGGATQILSRIPFRGPPARPAAASVTRSVAVTVAAGGTGLTVVAAHLTKPTTAGDRAERRLQMDDLGALSGDRRPLVVMGDFNAGLTSLDLRAMVAGSALDAPALQLPPVATWPGRFGPGGIQIDHVLATPEIAFERVFAGPRTGSNHLPVVADLALGCTRQLAQGRRTGDMVGLPD